MNGENDRIELTAQDITRMFSDPEISAKYPPILTIEEMAALLRVPKATIYDWRSRGLLYGCCKKVGRHLRFFRDKLLKKVFCEGL